MNSNSLSPSEYNPYYKPYIATLGEVDLLKCLKDDLGSFVSFMEKLPDERLIYSYDAKKWSIAEVLIHLLDAERVFQYRAMRFARNDTTEIPGFDQDLYVLNSRANERSKKSIIEEFKGTRKATIALFDSLNTQELMRIGIASGSEMSVRALGFVICGHLKHHKRILQERYV